MRLDRVLGPKLGYLYDQTYREGNKDGSLTNLTPDERRDYDFFSSAIKAISNAVAPLLKGRPVMLLAIPHTVSRDPYSERHLTPRIPPQTHSNLA